jgi:hypothetical protein
MFLTTFPIAGKNVKRIPQVSRLEQLDGLLLDRRADATRRNSHEAHSDRNAPSYSQSQANKEAATGENADTRPATPPERRASAVSAIYRTWPMNDFPLADTFRTADGRSDQQPAADQAIAGGRWLSPIRESGSTTADRDCEAAEEQLMGSSYMTAAVSCIVEPAGDQEDDIECLYLS